MLAALIREVMRADGSTHPDEGAFLRDVAAEIDGLDDAWTRASEELVERDAVLEAAKQIKRSFAREEMYAAVEHVARAGSVTASEESLLSWLKAEWRISLVAQEEE